jgi:hypothetical protein
MNTTAKPENQVPFTLPGSDPYSTADSLHLLANKAPRRTLDDMRKLSEEIKRTRAHRK